MPVRHQRMFPIMGSDMLKAIPWEVLAPKSGQAENNHSQSLETLARRGGLGVDEACAVLDGVGWGRWDRSKPHVFWCARLMGLVHRHEHDAALEKPNTP